MNKLSMLGRTGAAAMPPVRDRLGLAIRSLIRRVVIVGIVAVATAQTSAWSQNVLVNGDFENITQISWANNIPGNVTPWVLGGGDQANVVKVRADGTYHYQAGPWMDASGVGGSGPRHYLDVVGQNDIYQSFTPPCDGEVDFGGFFSSRCQDNGMSYQGTGSIKIVKGTGTGGAVVGTTNTATLPANHNAHTDAWVPVTFSATLTAGQVYSFVVTMDQNVNFDEAYVKYKTTCDVAPTPTATATATPTISPGPSGCASISDKDLHCQPDGSYSYTINVANNSGSAMSQVLLTPVAGSTFTLGSQLTDLSSTLANGQTTTVTTNIGNAKPGDKICFFVSLMSDSAPCCTMQVCTTLPQCGVIESPTPPPPPLGQHPGSKRSR